MKENPRSGNGSEAGTRDEGRKGTTGIGNGQPNQPEFLPAPGNNKILTQSKNKKMMQQEKIPTINVNVSRGIWAICEAYEITPSELVQCFLDDLTGGLGDGFKDTAMTGQLYLATSLEKRRKVDRGSVEQFLASLNAIKRHLRQCEFDQKSLSGEELESFANNHTIINQDGLVRAWVPSDFIQLP